MEQNNSDQFRHNLIQDEFRSVLTSESYALPIATDGVVVLSAAPTKNEQGEVVNEMSPDNIVRVKQGVQVIKQIVSQKTGQPFEAVTPDEMRMGPPLILNGETEQLAALLQIAESLHVPAEMIMQIDCGRRGVGNTKTQFEAINDDKRFEEASHFTFITNDWHAPRVARTALANLDENFTFDVIPSRASDGANIFRLVRGEVRRIEEYSRKGDISRNTPKTSKKVSIQY